MITSDVEVGMLRFVNRMTLPAAGKALTSTIRIAPPQGDVDLKVVFDKQ
jgi:hypothetical protein